MYFASEAEVGTETLLEICRSIVNYSSAPHRTRVNALIRILCWVANIVAKPRLQRKSSVDGRLELEHAALARDQHPPIP